jgi:hypothetical protein
MSLFEAVVAAAGAVDRGLVPWVTTAAVTVAPVLSEVRFFSLEVVRRLVVVTRGLLFVLRAVELAPATGAAGLLLVCPGRLEVGLFFSAVILPFVGLALAVRARAG